MLSNFPGTLSPWGHPTTSPRESSIVAASLRVAYALHSADRPELSQLGCRHHPVSGYGCGRAPWAVRFMLRDLSGRQAGLGKGDALLG